MHKHKQLLQALKSFSNKQPNASLNLANNNYVAQETVPFFVSTDFEFDQSILYLRNTAPQNCPSKTRVALLVGESNFLSILPELQKHADTVILFDIEPKILEHNQFMYQLMTENKSLQDFKCQYSEQKNPLIENKYPLTVARLLKDSGINRTKTTFNQEYAKRLLMKGQSMISTDHFTASHQRYLACRRALHKMQVQFIKLDLLNTKSIDCFKRILEQHSVTITVINLSNIFDYDGNYALRNHGTQPAKTWNTTGRLYDSLERCCEVEQQLIILYSRIELDENKRIQRLISRHAASVDEYILQTTEYSMQANKFFSSYQYDFNKPKKSTNLKNTKPIF